MSAEHWEPIQTSKLAQLHEFPLYETIAKFNSLDLNKEKQKIENQFGHQGNKDILKPHQTTLEAVQKTAKDPALSGYTHSCGLPEARKALAEFYSTSDYTISVENVILFQGPDMAQNHLMRAFCNPGENFLIPSPSVGLWEETAPGYEVVCKKYKLIPEKNWEVDLQDLESQIDSKTKFILVVNPSNPCGSVYSEEHLKQIIAVAEKHKLPIIADEAMEGAVFEGNKAVSIAKISGDVPVLQMGGLAEQYFAFGWNTSWMIMYDRLGVMGPFNKGLQGIMQLMLHAATFVSSTIPELLEGPQQKYQAQEIMPRVRKNADTLCEGLQKLEKFIKGIKPQGGFSMLGLLNFESFKDITNEEEFVEKLYTEESVMLLPSRVFHYKGAVRFVTCLQEELYPEMLKRLENFCNNHAK